MSLRKMSSNPSLLFAQGDLSATEEDSPVANAIDRFYPPGEFAAGDLSTVRSPDVDEMSDLAKLIPAGDRSTKLEELEQDSFDNDRTFKDKVKKVARHPMSTIQIMKMGSFWFGYQFYWFLLSIVIVPKQVEDIMGSENKGKGLSFTSLAAGVLNLFLAVILGALSDRVASRYGKRRGWMVAGTVAMCVSLLLLSGSSSLAVYTFGYLCMTASAVVASIPYNGLVADVTHDDQKGTVSAILGAMNLAGYLAGAIVGALVTGEGGLGIHGLYLIVMGVLSVSAVITVLSVNEVSSLQLKGLPPIDWLPFLRDLMRPLWTHEDFRLVFISRFLFQLGIATVQQFLQYWIGDCVTINIPAPQAVSYALIPLLVLSPIGALFIPAKKRKIVVYVSSAFMVTTCLMMQYVTSFPMALIASGIFGFGYGPFISTEFAMLMDVLPSEEEAAKDMALWHSALVLPQIVATPVAGWMLDIFQDVGRQHSYQCLGYNVVFGVCVIYFVWGVIVTKQIKGIL